MQSIEQKAKCYLMISEFGEFSIAFSNMKKAYEFLKSNSWQNTVNYSYFSRTINKENNWKFWEYKPIPEFRSTSKVRIIPIKIF